MTSEQMEALASDLESLAEAHKVKVAEMSKVAEVNEKYRISIEILDLLTARGEDVAATLKEKIATLFESNIAELERMKDVLSASAPSGALAALGNKDTTAGSARDRAINTLMTR